MKQVEPSFQPVSGISVNWKLDMLYEEEKRSLLSQDQMWRSFWGCTVPYIHR